jgi:hypothetical protein
MKSQSRLRLRRPGGPQNAPKYDWGVAWFGTNAESGNCHRCQRAGMVYQGYNGGAHMGQYCSPCKQPVLRGDF